MNDKTEARLAEIGNSLRRMQTATESTEGRVLDAALDVIRRTCQVIEELACRKARLMFNIATHAFLCEGADSPIAMDGNWIEVQENHKGYLQYPGGGWEFRKVECGDRILQMTAGREVAVVRSAATYEEPFNGWRWCRVKEEKSRPVQHYYFNTDKTHQLVSREETVKARYLQSPWIRATEEDLPYLENMEEGWELRAVKEGDTYMAYDNGKRGPALKATTGKATGPEHLQGLRWCRIVRAGLPMNTPAKDIPDGSVLMYLDGEQVWVAGRMAARRVVREVLEGVAGELKACKGRED